MNPRALAAWSAVCLFVALATTDPVYRALIALVALNVVIAGARPEAPRRPVLATILLAGLFALPLNLLLSRSGDHHLLETPFGPLTLEALVFGAGTGLGLLAAGLAVAPLTLAYEAGEVVDALPAPLERTGTVVAAALGLVPRLVDSFTAVREAQQMRGWRPGLRNLPEVALPALLTAIEGAVDVAEAMEARAYGSGPRTALSGPRWTWRDSLVALGALAALLAFAVHPAAQWYPYPALTWPAADPLLVGATLVLSLPALLWRSRPSAA